MLVSERIGQFFVESSSGRDRLEYTEYGAGDAWVVLLHGQLMPRRMHQSLARALAAEGLHVLTLDLLGHGRSVPYAGRLQVFHSVEKTPFLEVEGVIVGQGAAIYASRSKDFDHRVIGTKVEDLRRTRPRLLVIGKGALQVDDAQVSQNQQGQHVAPRLLGAQGT